MSIVVPVNYYKLQLSWKTEKIVKQYEYLEEERYRMEGA